MLFYLYLCHLLEFNSHLTGDRQSTEITNDNNRSGYSILFLLFKGSMTQVFLPSFFDWVVLGAVAVVLAVWQMQVLGSDVSPFVCQSE